MAKNIKTAQLQTFSIYGAGALMGDVTLTLKSMKDIDGNAITMSSAFGTKGFGTIQPGSGEFEEQISFTGLTNNTNGTTTLTGVKTVLFLDPYTEVSGLAKTHPGSVPFVISNTSGYEDTMANTQNEETIIEPWTFNAVANGANPKIDDDTYVPASDEYIVKAYTERTYLRLDTTNDPLTGELDMGNHKIVNLTDPTANQDAVTKIYVDNSIAAGGVPADVGTAGLVNIATQGEFDAGTDTDVIGGLTYYNMPTISQVKNSPLKKVGVGDLSNTSWFNFQPLFEQPNTNVGHKEVWAGLDTYGPMKATLNNTTFEIHAPNTVDWLLYNFTDDAEYDFNNTNPRKLIVEGVVIVGNDNQNAGWGIGRTGSDLSALNESGICFMRNAGTWYAYVGNGSTHTKTAVTVSSSAAGTKNVFRIEYNPVTPNALFYVDGTLVATITTTFPTTGGTGVKFQVINSSQSPIQGIGCPSFAVEI